MSWWTASPDPAWEHDTVADAELHLAVALTMIPEDQPPRLARGGDGLAAELPFGWLADVWVRGLTTCWGRFCLAAAPQPAADGWLLSTVGPDLEPPRPIALGSPPPS